MVNIKGIYNIVANVISRLDYSLTIDDKADWTTFMHCWCHYTMHATNAKNTYNHQEQLNMVFANQSDEDVIYSLSVKESEVEGNWLIT
jgi:hypothetical protein